MPDITFSTSEYLKDAVAPPVRAATMLPRWFKDLAPDCPATPDQFPVGTAKRCMPLLDVLTAGYLLTLPVAVHVLASEEEEVNFNWRTGPEFIAVETHSPAQTGNPPESGPTFKWVNPWTITTPPGYSTLFTQPFNRPDIPFTCYSAIVDTDTYDQPVNFPFDWVEYPYEGILDQGTPIIQAIPFKREEWTHEIVAGPAPNPLKVPAKSHYYKSTHHQRKTW